LANRRPRTEAPHGDPQPPSPLGAVFFEPDELSPRDPFDPPPSDEDDDDDDDPDFSDDVPEVAFFGESPESPEALEEPSDESPVAALWRARESVE
jgi:hypothetical protein